MNNDGVVDGNLGVNEALRGRLRFGKRVFMTDGTTAGAEEIRMGEETSLFNVLATFLFRGLTAEVRGALGLISVPLRVPFCQVPAFTCASGNDVIVPDYATTALVPGSYGTLVVGDGATLNLDPNATYTFCGVRIGRSAFVQSTDRTTINVAMDITIGAGSRLWTPSIVNDLPLILNVGGTKVRISQAAVVEAAITAPDAKLKIQREGQIYGCFCTNQLTSDKQVLLECVDTTGP